eukprot:scaffold105678_cov32-Tisochrysis_lutea.AAC.5
MQRHRSARSAWSGGICNFATPPMECGEKWAPFALANGRRGAAGDRREKRREWLKSTRVAPGGGGAVAQVTQMAVIAILRGPLLRGARC